MSDVDRAMDVVEDLLERLSEDLKIEGEIEVVDDGETITGTIHGDDLGRFIGHHGHTIDAVQHLATRLAHGEDHRAPRRIVIDAGGYRERRREALIGMADDAATEALEHDREVSLPAMSAGERRIVHEHLRDRDDVETHSEGVEPERYLVVAAAG